MSARRRAKRAAGTTAIAAGAVAVILLLVAGDAEFARAAAPAGGAPKVKSVTLAMRHRVFANFSDVQTVELQKDFLVGDSDYSARVVRYVPDFVMALKSGKVVSRSTMPNNPAFQIIVREKNVPQDTTWAFLNMPPHFGRKSLLAFKIVRIDFVGAPPLLADTTRTAPPAPHGESAVTPIKSHGGGAR